MFLSRKLHDKILSLIPMVTLMLVCTGQWLFFSSSNFYLVFDKLILFYWLIYRPDRISIFWVCILYLIPDIKEGWSLGFSSLLTLLFIWSVLLQRHVLLRQAFTFQWFALVVLISIYFIVYYVTASYLSLHALGILDMLVSAFISILSYPVLVRIFTKLQRQVPLHFELKG